MADGEIDHHAPPVEGPFTVVWEFINPDIPRDDWHPHTRVVDTEREAVHLWGRAKFFENTRPVSIDPEPNWPRYTHDGHTPLKR